MTMQTVFDLLKRGRGDPSHETPHPPQAVPLLPREKAKGGEVIRPYGRETLHIGRGRRLRRPAYSPSRVPRQLSPCGSVLSRLLMSPGHQFTTAKPPGGSQRAIRESIIDRFAVGSLRSRLSRSARYGTPLRCGKDTTRRGVLKRNGGDNPAALIYYNLTISTS